MIEVYDNLFDLNYKSKIYNCVKGSFFKIGWPDSNEFGKNYDFIHSDYSKEDIDKLEFFKKLENTPVIDHIKNLEYKLTRVNLSTPSDANFIHAHGHKLAILYYVNLDWQDGWHGETIFYDEYGKDIIFTSPYTPGRIIVFDPTIPHAIRPQSTIAPKFRFTLASFFDYPKENI
jgi:hypothetical protein